MTAAAVSADAKYNGLNSPDVSVTNRDNDGAGITVSAISGNTTEAGGTATFTIVLDSQPMAGVDDRPEHQRRDRRDDVAGQRDVHAG